MDCVTCSWQGIFISRFYLSGQIHVTRVGVVPVSPMFVWYTCACSRGPSDRHGPASLVFVCVWVCLDLRAWKAF